LAATASHKRALDNSNYAISYVGADLLSGIAPGADRQAIVEDPRFDEATFCRAARTISIACVLASAEQAGPGQ